VWAAINIPNINKVKIDNINIEKLPLRYYKDVSIIFIAFQISLKNIKHNIVNKPAITHEPIAMYKKSLSLLS
jgi:hypothetical protein